LGGESCVAHEISSKIIELRKGTFRAKSDR